MFKLFRLRAAVTLLAIVCISAGIYAGLGSAQQPLFDPTPNQPPTDRVRRDKPEYHPDLHQRPIGALIRMQVFDRENTNCISTIQPNSRLQKP